MATHTHLHTKIPSWLHMPTMGMPTVASWGENLGDMVDLAQVCVGGGNRCVLQGPYADHRGQSGRHV